MSWKPNEKKSGVTPVCNTTPNKVSKHDPNQPVTHAPSMSLKRNHYMADMISAGSDKMDVSDQEFVRTAIRRLCSELDIY